MRVLLLTVIVFGVGASAANAMQSVGNFSGERILSRRRRYLIFPDGSSLQLGMSYKCQSMNVHCSMFIRIFTLQTHPSTHILIINFSL